MLIIEIKLSKKIELPAGLQEKIKEWKKKVDANELTDLNSSDEKDRDDSDKSQEIMQIEMVNGNTNDIDTNLQSWELRELNSDSIKIGLIFRDPLKVS